MPDWSDGRLWNAVVSAVFEVFYVYEAPQRMREAVAFRIGIPWLVIRAQSTTSELSVTMENRLEEPSGYEVRDVTSDFVFQPFVGQTIVNWWFCRNRQGYDDAFLLGFAEGRLGPSRGLLFCGMNNEVSILTVAGELLA